MLTKNKLSPNQANQLKDKIVSFFVESGLNKGGYNPAGFVKATLRNIVNGIDQQYTHDIWIDDSAYVLCKLELDLDGEPVYTAYQLYIDPDKRDKHIYKRITAFLRFYAQKEKYKRFYIVSSRLDKIKAYQRGIGYSFKPMFLTFMEGY